MTSRQKLAPFYHGEAGGETCPARSL